MKYITNISAAMAPNQSWKTVLIPCVTQDSFTCFTWLCPCAKALCYTSSLNTLDADWRGAMRALTPTKRRYQHVWNIRNRNKNAMGIKLVLDVGFGTSERFPTIVIAKHQIHHGIVWCCCTTPRWNSGWNIVKQGQHTVAIKTYYAWWCM